MEAVSKIELPQTFGRLPAAPGKMYDRGRPLQAQKKCIHRGGGHQTLFKYRIFSLKIVTRFSYLEVSYDTYGPRPWHIASATERQTRANEPQICVEKCDRERPSVLSMYAALPGGTRDTIRKLLMTVFLQDKCYVVRWWCFVIWYKFDVVGLNK